MCGKRLRKKFDRILRLLIGHLLSKVSCDSSTSTSSRHAGTPSLDRDPSPGTRKSDEPATPPPQPHAPSYGPSAPPPQPGTPPNGPYAPPPQPHTPSNGSDAPITEPHTSSSTTRNPSPEPPTPSSGPLTQPPQPSTPPCQPCPSAPQPTTPSKEPCSQFPRPLLSLAKPNSKVNDIKTILPTTASSSLIMPSFILHAFAVLAGLRGHEQLEHACSFVSSFYAQCRTASICPAAISRQFFSFTLPSNSPLLTKSQFYSLYDPIRLAFAYLALSLPCSEDEANLVLQSQQAFLHLFRSAVDHSLIWDVFPTSSSFAWSSEPQTVRVFEISCTRFVASVIVLPVHENTWFEGRSLATGVLPAVLKSSYTTRNPESFLLSLSTPLRAMVAAAKYGADWNHIVKPATLSETRNASSWRLSTSGGNLFRGVYVEPIDHLLSILQFGCIDETKLYDVAQHDLPDSTAIRDIVAAAEAIRVEARTDKSRTFRETVVSRLTAIRGEIREAVAKFGCVFRSRKRYLWIGGEDGALRVKKAVRMRVDDILVTQPDDDAVVQFMRQDAKFLIEDSPGVVVRSTRELQEVEGLGDLGLCVMFSCWLHGRIRIDATYLHLIETMSRTLRARAAEKTCFQEFVCVDTAVPYTSLLVLADSVVVDGYGQGWVEGCFFVAGTDGRPGWLVPVDRQICCCKRRALVEAEFRVDPHLKIARR